MLNIEQITERPNEYEVDYFVNDGELQTISISKSALMDIISDNDLNVSFEDKWDYKNEEHYTIDYVTPIDEFLEENAHEVITQYMIERGFVS